MSRTANSSPCFVRVNHGDPGNYWDGHGDLPNNVSTSALESGPCDYIAENKVADMDFRDTMLPQESKPSRD